MTELTFMKTYVITISERFLATHSKKGQETNFITQIETNVKLHTIRGNYPFWAKRFDNINKGEDCLSIRVWTGKPYRSKQKEIFNLTKSDGIGIEKIDLYNVGISLETLAQNDGLSLHDFKEWFKRAKPGHTMAIIHFTKFRYYN